jgi:cytoskeletal protein RodZ
VAELRSFVVGVVVAGFFLGIVAVALGAFSSEGEESPQARLLGTPPASATARATQRPATTAQPTIAATRPVSPTAAATSTPGTATSPTAAATTAPTNTPQPQPTANPVSAYVNTTSVVVTDLGAQIDYLVNAGASNPSGSTQAAGTVKALAGRLLGLTAPACLSTAHGTLTQGAGSANSGADQLLAALNSSNQSAIAAALSTLSGAKATLGRGAGAISSANC